MTRLLLTLLALLTGLSAQTAPAAARAGEAAGAQVAVQMAECASQLAAVSQSASRPQTARAWVIPQASGMVAQPTSPTATVLTGIDRARE